MSKPAGFWRSLGLGAWRGVRAFLKLMLIVAPVYTIVTALRYTPAIRMFAEFMAPAMRYFGLPGEAALAVILGNVVNLYAGLGAVTALRLPANQLTVLALMLLISHSQILETAVFFRIRAKWWLLWAIRLVVSGLAGFGLAKVLVRPSVLESAGPAVTLAEKAQIPFVGLGPALEKWGRGLGDTALKMLLVLVGIFALLELARRYGLLEKMLTGLRRVIGFMGYSKEAGMPWLAGNVFGIVFGAGLIIESVEEGKLSAKQVTLVATFLALCHGLFEDTAIFIVLGANLFWIVVPRIVLAVGVTWLLGILLKEEKERS
uniref:Nucleoside transporter/FeoB GTPase Gate domain-containing protein n=1 Tax=candidate division WOR-3 bacterium TaxID=2052148 RepID=A0A7C4CA90_UNCW3